MAKRGRNKRTASPPRPRFSRTPEDDVSNYNSTGPLPIRLYGDPVLRQKALPIRKITDVEQKLAKDMLATMYAAPNGVGLAAPQVGVLKRLIVIDLNRDDVSSKPLVLINPETQRLDGESIEDEGCLSIPNITAEVKRANEAVVSALDLNEETVSVETEGLLARVLQHEIDHLDGVLFIDRVKGFRRQVLRKKLRKLKNNTLRQ
ncbi:MAG: peptide deformylase [Candidatus Poribacteria bacterium]|nr:peptide deformylase [Candidatus Poribacteria bacterium]